MLAKALLSSPIWSGPEPTCVDDFDGADGTPADPTKWTEIETTTGLLVYSAMFSDNQLQLSIEPTVENGSNTAYIDYIPTIYGDFDVEVDFDNLVLQNHFAAGITISAYFDNGSAFHSKVSWENGNIFHQFFDNQGAISSYKPARTNSFGKIGLYIDGWTCTAKYKDGNDDWAIRTVELPNDKITKLSLSIYDYKAGGTTSGDVDNFIVTGRGCDV